MTFSMRRPCLQGSHPSRFLLLDPFPEGGDSLAHSSQTDHRVERVEEVGLWECPPLPLLVCTTRAPKYSTARRNNNERDLYSGTFILKRPCSGAAGRPPSVQSLKALPIAGPPLPEWKGSKGYPEHDKPPPLLPSPCRQTEIGACCWSCHCPRTQQTTPCVPSHCSSRWRKESEVQWSLGGSDTREIAHPC